MSAISSQNAGNLTCNGAKTGAFFVSTVKPGGFVKKPQRFK